MFCLSNSSWELCFCCVGHDIVVVCVVRWLLWVYRLVACEVYRVLGLETDFLSTGGKFA